MVKKSYVFFVFSLFLLIQTTTSLIITHSVSNKELAKQESMQNTLASR